MKKIIAFCLVFCSFFTISYAENKDKKELQFTESCPYKSEISTCLKAVEDWTYKTIDDYTCISHNDWEFVLMNLILDKKFKKTDEKIHKYIAELEKNRTKYFSTDLTYLDAFEDINDKLWVWWEYWTEYSNYCNGWWEETSILKETASCLKSGIVSSNVKSFLISKEPKNTCLKFAENKLSVYRFTASQILKINKWQMWRDDNKTFMTKQRWFYDKLLDKIIANVRYLDTILKWWPSKTKTVHN